MVERGGGAEFVGRERELGLLSAALGEARAGRGTALGIAGDPGIGKTRLVDEFTRALDPGTARALWGRCPEGGGAPAYWPWRQALAPLLDPARAAAGAPAPAAGDPRLQGALAVLAGGLDQRPTPDDSEQTRFGLLEAVVRLLHAAGADVPLVLVLDDVHWADEASLKLVGHVARELRGARVLLVLTYREPELRRLARPLGEITRFSRRIGLRGLGRDEIERFVAQNGAVTPSSAMVRRLAETTEGNPFFLDELVTLLRESGELDSHDDAVARLELPDGVRDAIRRRIDPLPANEQELLELAAVIGRDFAVAALAAATGEAPDAILARLAGAVAAGLVHDLGTLGEFRFAHALVRETLYAGLLPAARVGGHRQVAQALERLLEQGTDVPLAALAHHFFLAVPLGEAAKASLYAERAGGAAMRQFAYAEATTQYDRALSALGFAGDDPPRRIRLLLAYGDAALQAGDRARAADVFVRAARLARERGDSVRLALAAMRHAYARGAFLAADPVVVRLLESALAALGEADHPVRVFVLTSLSAALVLSRERARCAGICEEALAMARRIGDPTALATALMAQHYVLLGSPDVARRIEIADEALACARRGGRTETEWSARAARVNDLIEQGDLATAESEIERLGRLADASRAPVLMWGGLLARACLALLAGRFADAERLSAEAIAARRGGEDAAVTQIFVTQTFFRRLETGGVADCEEMLARIARDFPDDSGWRTALALLWTETGREAEARAILDEVAALDFADLPNDANFLGNLAVLALLVHRLGDAARAARLHERLAPFAASTVVAFIQPVLCLGAVTRYLGLLAETMGDDALAARHLADAIAVNTRIGARPYAARARFEYARLLLRRGDGDARAAATRLLAEARAAAGQLAQHRLREEIAALSAPATPAAPAAAATPPAAPAAPAHAAADTAETAVLRKDGDVWTVEFRSERFHLKDSKGLQLLAVLLRHPGREVHVLDLVTGPAADEAIAGDDAGQLSIGGLGDAGELLDPAARAAYKRRLEDLRDELEEAERFQDVGRASRARNEIDFLTAEIARGVGLGGRARRAASAAERARQNACRTIAAALKKIGAGSTPLGQHLAVSVSTGLFCCYDPSALPPIAWLL